ncbi:unnamed protein product [Ectocarpus sp. 12 AP-2014]
MCVYECRHPLWGGSGTCTNGDEPTCLCDAGYAVMDALGFPSCVRALSKVYWALTVAAAAMVVFIFWHAEKDRHLSTATRATRRAKLRKRVVIFAAIANTCVVFVAALAASRSGGAGLFAGVSFYIFYGVSLPCGNVAVSAGAAVWVERLPSQARMHLLPPDSIAARLKSAAEEKSVFIWLGSGMVGVMALLTLMASFFSILKMMTVINLMSAFTCCIAMSCVLFVGVVITRVIILAKAKASAAGRIMYTRALKRLWTQVFVLVSMASTWMTAALALELSRAGHSTPIIPLSYMIIDGCGLLSLLVHFSEVRDGTGNRLVSQASKGALLVSQVSNASLPRPRALVSECRPEGNSRSEPTKATQESNNPKNKVVPV